MNMITIWELWSLLWCSGSGLRVEKEELIPKACHRACYCRCKRDDRQA